MKNLSISSFNRLPLAFLSSLLLFLVILAVVTKMEAFWRFCYLYSDPSVDDAIRLEAQLRIMPCSNDKIRIFITGSSQAREDFDIENLNVEFEKAGVVFYNLGISGEAQPIEMFMLRDKLLEKNPKIIIYVPFVGSFYSDYNFRRMRYYFNPAIIPQMLKYVGVTTVISYREYFLDSFLGQIEVLYRYRDLIKGIFIRAVKHYINSGRRTEPRLFAYTKNKPKSYFEMEIGKAKRNKYHFSRYTKINKDLFIGFANDVILNGTKLIVITGPTHPLIKKVYDEEIDIAFNQFLSEQAGRFGFIYLSENDLPSFTEADFIDFTHLNASGRNKLSEFLRIYLQGNNLI